MDSIPFNRAENQVKHLMVWCDNISIVALLANPILHSRTKHMELDLYFIQENVL